MHKRHLRSPNLVRAKSRLMAIGILIAPLAAEIPTCSKLVYELKRAKGLYDADLCN
jgi:hypothetical protein